MTIKIPTRFLSRFLSYNVFLFLVAAIHLYISNNYGHWAIAFDTTVLAAVLATLAERYDTK